MRRACCGWAQVRPCRHVPREMCGCPCRQAYVAGVVARKYVDVRAGMCRTKCVDVLTWRGPATYVACSVDCIAWAGFRGGPRAEDPACRYKKNAQCRKCQKRHHHHFRTAFDGWDQFIVIRQMRMCHNMAHSHLSHIMTLLQCSVCPFGKEPDPIPSKAKF